jgi:hypothetical protein
VRPQAVNHGVGGIGLHGPDRSRHEDCMLQIGSTMTSGLAPGRLPWS